MNNFKGVSSLLAMMLTVAMAYLIYDIYSVRGREIDHEATYSRKSDWSVPQPNDDVEFSILPHKADYILTLSNKSFRPYYFMLYEYLGWKHELPDEYVLRYARRHTLLNGLDTLLYDIYPQFDCGSGLAYTTIRPFESFVDTISTTQLLAGLATELQRVPVSPHHRDYYLRLNLPLTAYATGKPSFATSNAVKVSPTDFRALPEN